MCKYFKETKSEPHFTFYISINDWEQDALDGPDIRRYPFNIYPVNTSLQYLPDEYGCCRSTVDHWQPIIEYNVKKIENHFPEISFKFIRNSSLKNNQYFKNLFLDTLEHPEKISNICEKYSGKEVLSSPLIYGGAICPICSSAHGKTLSINPNNILWRCDKCHHREENNYSYFDYWWYHKPLFIARLKIFNIDLTISGGDHYSEGDFNIREALIDVYDPTIKKPKMIFTPLVLALNGEKMSKSRNNTDFVNLDLFLNYVDNNFSGEIKIPRELITKYIDVPVNHCRV